MDRDQKPEGGARAGGDLFIVDNSDTEWKGLRYLQEWAQISTAFDIATGLFETAPEGLPWAVPYDELENKRKSKVPARVKSIRGKLNVPRERFHLRGKTMYLWAGLQFG